MPSVNGGYSGRPTNIQESGRTYTPEATRETGTGRGNRYEPKSYDEWLSRNLVDNVWKRSYDYVPNLIDYKFREDLRRQEKERDIQENQWRQLVSGKYLEEGGDYLRHVTVIPKKEEKPTRLTRWLSKFSWGRKILAFRKDQKKQVDRPSFFVERFLRGTCSKSDCVEVLRRLKQGRYNASIQKDILLSRTFRLILLFAAHSCKEIEEKLDGMDKGGAGRLARNRTVRKKLAMIRTLALFDGVLDARLQSLTKRLDGAMAPGKTG